MHLLINEARQDVENLAITFEKKAEIAKTVLEVLKRVQSWLKPLLPYGPTAVVAVYVGAVSFAILSGGDHIDWDPGEEWPEILDRVSGVRRQVEEAVSSSN